MKKVFSIILLLMIIFISSNIQRFSKRYNSENIENKGKNDVSLFTGGTLLEGDTVIIYGKGEMYFNRIENQN